MLPLQDNSMHIGLVTFFALSVYNDFFSFYIYIVMLQERGHIAVTLYSIVSPNVY